MTSIMQTEAVQACGRFLFRRRSKIFPIVLIGMLLSLPPVYPRGSATLDLAVDLLGVIVVLSGQALRALVIGFAYIKRGGLNKQVYAETLVTRGMFGLARNPLYVGNLLILLGLFLVHGNPLVLLVGVPLFIAAYVSIVAAEESYLRRRFGEQYEDYCRRVPRWWPDFRGFAEATAGMRFDCRRVIAKDHGSALAWLAGLLVLLSYEVAHHTGAKAAVPWLATAAVVIGGLLLATAAARRAKRAERLGGRTA